jgi:type VI secretion system secreted protein VgrG
VSGDRTIAVKAGKHTETIKGDTAITVESGNHSLTVQTGTHTKTIKGDTSVVVQSGAYSLDVQNNNHTHHVKGAVTENYDDIQETFVNSDVLIKSKTATITVDAATEIRLQCGSSMLSMNQFGVIRLSGTDIEIASSGNATMRVGSQSVTCNQQTVHTQGAKVNTTAVGMHEISGALIKIN